MSKLNKVMKSLKEMYSHKIPEFRAELIAAQEKKERKKEKKRKKLEKSYQKRIDVPQKGKRKAYSYFRNYDGIEGKNNSYKRIQNADGIETAFNNKLKAKEVKNLAVCTDEQFSQYVDDMFAKNYKRIPAIIRMPDLNGKLTQKLHLANVCCYMEKGRFYHINPDRKSNYNQAFSKEEYKRIPAIIRNAKAALYDSEPLS